MRDERSVLRKINGGVTAGGLLLAVLVWGRSFAADAARRPFVGSWATFGKFEVREMIRLPARSNVDRRHPNGLVEVGVGITLRDDGRWAAYGQRDVGDWRVRDGRVELRNRGDEAMLRDRFGWWYWPRRVASSMWGRGRGKFDITLVPSDDRRSLKWTNGSGNLSLRFERWPDE